MMKALVFNIQRMSLHDGPGVRTTVFFKGCTLHCRWCHNPESIIHNPELEWNPWLCIRCGACMEVCIQGARRESGYNRNLCKDCGACAAVCVSGASKLVGEYMEIETLLKEVIKDKRMYELTGGGVTCSGGEPLLQVDAVKEFLMKLRKAHIHTAVDTAGNVSWSAFEKVVPYTDLFLFDIKSLDREVHKKYTGFGNEKILKNFGKLVQMKDIFVRIPVIKDVNDKELRKIAEFLKGKEKVKQVELLPYHALGRSKYEGLGKKEELFRKPELEMLKKEAAYFESCGLPCKVAEIN